MGLFSFLDRSRTVAPLHYNRWLVPPAALAIHLCIGQIYAYSVFKLPMTKLIGIAEPGPEDWQQKQIAWIFTIALFCLGASAATFGKWMERVGPRKAMFASALCFSGGFFISSIGVSLHEIWIVYLGHGVIGGIGLGLGYISPVSTLIKWFPDRPGMATGLAIMGFGGGAMIASPLATWLMGLFRTASSVGVEETFLAMGCIYLCMMLFGMFAVRVPHPEWQPAGFEKGNAPAGKMITTGNVLADKAIRTPQFYLLFGVLLLNVSAGIGLLEHASVMVQELFSKETVGDRWVSADAAAGFVGLLSLFNMAGRFIWSSTSDFIGRKLTYILFFSLGAILFFTLPFLGTGGHIGWFVAAAAFIMTMYGGGFATIPAYLKDIFGVIQVGAIHGRLLLAWSLAAIVGPVVVNNLRASQIEAGASAAETYPLIFMVLAGLLLAGFVCNIMVNTVNPIHHHQAEKGK